MSENISLVWEQTGRSMNTHTRGACTEMSNAEHSTRDVSIPALFALNPREHSTALQSGKSTGSIHPVLTWPPRLQVFEASGFWRALMFTLVGSSLKISYRWPVTSLLLEVTDPSPKFGCLRHPLSTLSIIKPLREGCQEQTSTCTNVVSDTTSISFETKTPSVCSEQILWAIFFYLTCL